MRNRAVVMMGALSVALAFGACGGEGDDMGSGGSSSGGSGTGGKPGTGGSATGGKGNTGGKPGTGGSATGGKGNTGGKPGTGGSATGGKGNTGGMGGDSMGGFGGLGGFGGASEACEPAAVGNLLLNEIDANGDPEDWVELYALGSPCVDLSGVQLIDGTDPTDPDTYVFADGTELTMGDYLVVERTTDFAFGLKSGGGEDVTIFDGADTMLDTVLTIASADTETYARTPDGSTTWTLTTTKTRGAANPTP